MSLERCGAVNSFLMMELAFSGKYTQAQLTKMIYSNSGMFGQLSNRESLRDLIIALGAHRSKCYHLGMGKNVSKSSLARTNQDRDYRIFEEFAYSLVNEAQKKRKTDIFKLGGNVYAFDSTTIDLCLAVFWWAKFRKKKGGIKVHTLYDVETQIPTFFHITPASVHASRYTTDIFYTEEPT